MDYGADSWARSGRIPVLFNMTPVIFKMMGVMLNMRRVMLKMMRIMFNMTLWLLVKPGF